MLATQLIEKDDYHHSLRLLLQSLNSIVSNKNYFFYNDQQIYHTDNFFNTFFNAVNLQKKSSIKPLVSILKNYCYRTEKLAAGSSQYFIDFVITFLNRSLVDLSSDQRIQTIENKLDNFLEHINIFYPFCIEQTSLSKIQIFLRNYVLEGQPKLSSMLYEAINLGGLESKILCETTKNSKSCIELRNGYNFKIKPPNEFYDKNNRWQRNNVKVLIIDGVVDKVSEIDHLLQICNQTKTPMLICAQGFHKEVLQTLKVNFYKQTLDVLPVEIFFDIDNLNIINDIAVVCDTDIVSSLKGQVLTFIKYEDLKFVDSVVCFGQTLTINNEKGKLRAKNQFTQLMQQIDHSATNEMLMKSLNNRIRSLTTNVVTLKIASINKSENIKDLEKIDLGIRTFQHLIKFGFLNKEKFISYLNDKEKEYYTNILEKYSQIPSLSFLSSIKFAIDFTKKMINIDSLVIKD